MSLTVCSSVCSPWMDAYVLLYGCLCYPLYGTVDVCPSIQQPVLPNVVPTLQCRLVLGLACSTAACSVPEGVCSKDDYAAPDRACSKAAYVVPGAF
jgi:hypothetical protein